jgi:hypothetical protein
MRRAEIILWVLLAAAVIPAVVVATLLLPVLVLFGRDVPGTTALQHLWILMQPLLGVGGVVVGAWASHRLFRSGYVVLAFLVAAALCVGVWTLGYALRPH